MQYDNLQMHSTAIWKLVAHFKVKSFNSKAKRLFVNVKYNAVWGTNVFSAYASIVLRNITVTLQNNNQSAKRQYNIY